MHESKMRHIVIYGDANTDVIDQLSSISDWVLQPLGIPGGYDYCLAQGETKVAIRTIAPNVVQTVNVLPHDHREDYQAANEALISLSKSLDLAGISNSLSASDEDIA